MIETASRLIVDANNRFAEIIGRSVAEVIGLDWADITHADDVAANLIEAARLLGGENAEFKLTKRYLLPGGAPVWVDMWVVALDTDLAGRRRHLCMIEDITERRREVLELAESEHLYRLLADNVGDVVLLFRDGLIEWVSPSVTHLLGYLPEHLIGNRTIDWIHPDDQAVVLANRELLMSGTQIWVRARHLRTDGSWLWIEYNARPLTGDNGAPDGSAVSTMWNVQAEVEALERLQHAESLRLAAEARSQRQARLESLGALAGGVAHDFNNLLAGILANAGTAVAELAALDAAPAVFARGLLEQIVTATERGASLTRRLLDYAGDRPAPIPQAIPLGATLGRDLEVIAPALGAAIRLDLHVDSDVAAVWCDPADWHQIFSNLVINAAEAFDGNPGMVQVRASLIGAGASVLFEVIDHGRGMVAADAARVFEPFFTTKIFGHGLGLAVVFGVVQANGGTIELQSQFGEGTTVRVVLPACELASEAPQPTPERSSEPAARQHSARATATFGDTIILVDDNDDLREVCELILERHGLKVVAVSGGAEAIQVVQRAPHEFGLAVVDMSMPEMNGTDVVRALRQIIPGLPSVVMTGYSSTDVMHQLREVEVDALMEKPFRPDDLIRIVSELLGRVSDE